MNLILVSVLLIIFAAGIVSKNSSENTLPTSTPTPTQTTSATPSATRTPNISPSLIPTATPTPMVTNDTTSVSSDWIYPGSVVLSTGDKLALSSSTNTDDISDWYKSKIMSLGFNVKSFVKTSANDTIKNVLSAAKADREVSVQITKNPGDTSARIEVTDSL